MSMTNIFVVMTLKGMYSSYCIRRVYDYNYQHEYWYRIQLNLYCN